MQHFPFCRCSRWYLDEIIIWEYSRNRYVKTDSGYQSLRINLDIYEIWTTLSYSLLMLFVAEKY